MASFNDPKLSNHIADDVSAIRQLLRSVAALDPATGNTDIPNGAKRLVETAQGYEFQSYNGTAWVALEKWNLDVQKVDGHSASTGTTANTIPVRDADGKLPGDITGNAATATKAAALSATNPIPTGGTGGTTAAEARANLGVPPTDHASSGTDYGIGTGSNYGHVKLSDSTSSALAASAGIAASPKAVKDAYDRASTAITNAGNAQTTAIAAQSAADGKAPKAHASSATTYGIGTGSNYGHVKLSDSTSSTSEASAGIAASPKAVKDAYDKAVAAIPVGSVIAFAGNPSSAPSGYLLCNGAAVSRTTYAALFSVIGGTYGVGNGSTTFNLPNLIDKFIQGRDTSGGVIDAGLPEVYGYITAVYVNTNGSAGGAFSLEETGSQTNGDITSSWRSKIVRLHASDYNAIYGNSSTVQPPAVTMRYYIKY